jgi:hypothetical protein
MTCAIQLRIASYAELRGLGGLTQSYEREND